LHVPNEVVYQADRSASRASPRIYALKL
jgi:hypothetical protein